MKKLATIFLTVAVATSVMCTTVFAVAGKTVTFNGGHIYQAEQGKPGTIKLDITNIDSQANVKMDTKELLTYLDDVKTANEVVYTDEDGKGYSINSIVQDLNKKGGIPVYYASSMPVITAKTPMTAFMMFWKGDDVTKATFIPKYWSFEDYLANEDKAKVYTTQPKGNWLFAPGTANKVNKTGNYLVVVHDSGATSNSPLSVLCVNVGETPSTIVTTKDKPIKDTPTKITLDGRTRFTVELQADTLVFSNEPIYAKYDSISLEVNNIIGDVFSSTTYDRGKGNGATVSLVGVPDGSYQVRFRYVTNGYKRSCNMYDFSLEIKDGVASFKAGPYYVSNLKVTANERTDAYALDYYKYIGLPDERVQMYVKQANLITKGITDDYAKVKAIHDWVATNMYYDMADDYTVHCKDPDVELFPGSGVKKRGVCSSYAGVTRRLMQAAGFPAKCVVGGTTMGVQGHDWNEVYVDGRWIFLDTTFDSKNIYDGTFIEPGQCSQTYFDTTIAEWSCTHEIGSRFLHEEAEVWNGSLYIKKIGPTGTYQDKLLKEIKNFPLNGLLTTTYGYKATDMYTDISCTERWNLDKTRVGFSGKGDFTIYVKLPTHTVTFDTQGGTAVASMELKPNADGDVRVPKPDNPTRKGYIFTGWVVGNPDNSTKWDFKNWTINYDNVFYATWQKQ